MILTLISALILAQAAPEWPTFRGPTGDGVAPATAQPPVEWSETSNVAWKAAIPGRGRKIVLCVKLITAKFSARVPSTAGFRSPAGDVVPQGLAHARLADSRLARQQHHRT